MRSKIVWNTKLKKVNLNGIQVKKYVARCKKKHTYIKAKFYHVLSQLYVTFLFQINVIYKKIEKKSSTVPPEKIALHALNKHHVDLIS